MQNAGLYRRGIVLPLDDDAEEGLRFNDVAANANARVLRIADDGAFESLWRLGLFREINARCGTLLDDFEEEWIEAASVGKVVAAVDSVVRRADAEAVLFLEELRELAGEASRRSRPLLFVL